MGYVLGNLLSQNWYGGYGYGYSWPYYTYTPAAAYPVYVESPVSVVATDAVVAAPVELPTEEAVEPTEIATDDFAAAGEDAFKARNYSSAIRAWRHALLDDPENGTLVLMLSQALFAEGKYDEAAGAAQQGLAMLPQEHWGVVVTNYKQLYGANSDYASQLRSLEKARTEDPKSPALRFLLGYHYGFLNYPGNAVVELKQATELAPQDNLAQQLLELFLAKKVP